MPTSRPRHVVTETDNVSVAIDDAALRWPEDRASRSRLLLRLIQEGHRALLDEREREIAARREAITRTGGSLTGAFGAGYLKDLRKDWPE